MRRKIPRANPKQKEGGEGEDEGGGQAAQKPRRREWPRPKERARQHRRAPMNMTMRGGSG